MMQTQTQESNATRFPLPKSATPTTYAMSDIGFLMHGSLHSRGKVISAHQKLLECDKERLNNLASQQVNAIVQTSVQQKIV